MATALRPKQYHLRESRTPWLLAIIRLHAMGWNDREIAEAINLLTARDIHRMEQYNLWRAHKGRDIHACIEWNREHDATIHHVPWTTRQVHYYRRMLRLRPNQQRFEIGEDILTKTPGKLSEICSIHWRLYQTRRGWHHLMMADPPIVLIPRDVDLLCILWNQGEQDVSTLASAFGSDSRLRDGHGYSRLARLHRLGLIEVSGRRPRRARIREGIRPQSRFPSINSEWGEEPSVLKGDEFLSA